MKTRLPCFYDLRNGNESQKCLNLDSRLYSFLLFSRYFSLVCLLLFAWNNVEKLLTLTLETLGSKEVARWLVWLQNTKEHG